MTETINNLLDFMDNSHKTQRQIAKEIGISNAVISQFLNDSYIGDNAEIEKKIKRYLAVAQMRLELSRTDNFYPELYNTKIAQYVAYQAHLNCDITLVSGEAGTGKTTALKDYAENNTGVIFVTANACTTTATAVLSMICEALGEKTSPRRAVLMKRLIDILADSNRLIIIDEADHLKLEALQAVRNLNDEAHVGVVLAGNDKIYRQMVTGRKGFEFDQIRTRIVVRKRLSNHYEIDELQHIFPLADDKGLELLCDIAHRESLRTAKKIYNLVLVVHTQKNEKVSFRNLKAIRDQLLGDIEYDY